MFNMVFVCKVTYQLKQLIIAEIRYKKLCKKQSKT